METIRVDDHGGTPWIQTIYQTQELTNNNGRNPEEAAADHLSNTLDDLGIDHEIHYDFAPIGTTTQQAVCGSRDRAQEVARRSDILSTGDGRIGDPPLHGGAVPTAEDVLPDFEAHLEHSAEMVAADSNLIMTNAQGGGCAYRFGNVGASGARDIDHTRGIVTNGTDNWTGQVSAALHEIGHNMGYSHADHAGMAWNGPTYWHRTPYGPNHDPSGQEATNRCGEAIPSKQRSENMAELYYHDCVADTIFIEDKDPLNGNGNGNGNGDDPADVVIDILNIDDLTVELSASRSTGDITSYEWDMGDGALLTGETITHTYGQGGTYTVELFATSPGGNDVATLDVTVSEPGNGNGNGDGHVDAQFEVVTDGLTATFNGAISEGDGGIHSWDWDFGDGTGASGYEVTHTYDQGGQYTVTLEVSALDAGTDTRTRTIQVNGPDNGNGDDGGGGVDRGTGIAVAGGAILALLLARPENPFSDD